MPTGSSPSQRSLGYALLRGKVAYLFQRYNAEQEISAMLLCVGPSNQDVQTLPRMVKEWIDNSLGASTHARAHQRNSLFFVLTKFDAEFEDKAGEDASSEARWTARLQASLTDFFKSYDWPEEWTPGRPFDNLFWLRNPSIGFGAVFDYGPPPNGGGPAPEIGVAPRAAATVAQKRAAYLANDLVRKHVADPASAWDAASDAERRRHLSAGGGAGASVRPGAEGESGRRPRRGTGGRNVRTPASAVAVGRPCRQNSRPPKRARPAWCVHWWTAPGRRCSDHCCARYRSPQNKWPGCIGV